MGLLDRITQRPFGQNTALARPVGGYGAGDQYRQQAALYGRALRHLNWAGRHGDVSADIAAIGLRDKANAAGYTPGGLMHDDERNASVAGKIATQGQMNADAGQSGILSRQRTQDSLNAYNGVPAATPPTGLRTGGLATGGLTPATPVTPSTGTPSSPSVIGTTTSPVATPTPTLGGGAAGAAQDSGVFSPVAPASAPGNSPQGLSGLGLTSSIPALNGAPATPATGLSPLGLTSSIPALNGATTPAAPQSQILARVAGPTSPMATTPAVTSPPTSSPAVLDENYMPPRSSESSKILARSSGGLINGMPAHEVNAALRQQAASGEAPPKATTVFDELENAKAAYQHTLAGNGTDEEHKANKQRLTDLVALASKEAPPKEAPTQGSYKGSDPTAVARDEKAYQDYQATLNGGDGDPSRAFSKLNDVYHRANSIDQARINAATLVRAGNQVKSDKALRESQILKRTR
jgi:hypothetical protein